MARRPDPKSDASKMLTFLKKEADFYKKLIEHMGKEHMRLQIEEFALKSAIRLEQKKIDTVNETENNFKDVSSDLKRPSTSSSASTTVYDLQDSLSSSLNLQENEFTQSTRSTRRPEVETVCSNITDDRYLDSLVLNPNINGELIEFDD